MKITEELVVGLGFYGVPVPEDEATEDIVKAYGHKCLNKYVCFTKEGECSLLTSTTCGGISLWRVYTLKNLTGYMLLHTYEEGYKRKCTELKMTSPDSKISDCYNLYLKNRRFMNDEPEPDLFKYEFKPMAEPPFPGPHHAKI